MTTSFEKLSKTERIIRHLAACAIENQLEAGREVTAESVADETRIHLEDGRYFRDEVFATRTAADAAYTRLWSNPEARRAKVQKAAEWLMKQDAVMVARFIATPLVENANPEDPTARFGVQHHIDFLNRKNWNR